MGIQQCPSSCNSLHGVTKITHAISPISSLSRRGNSYKKANTCAYPYSDRAILRISRSRSRSSSKSRLVVRSSSSGSLWEDWWKSPDKSLPSAPAVSLSDVLWPSAGAFAAMAILGRVDQLLAPRGLSMTIAPLGAVCAVLFANPNSPAAKKYNMFVAQIGCAAIGVLAFSFFGPGWLARATALSASIAFMLITGASHPPAASLPILFIDGAKFHSLNLWYVLFPGAISCMLLCLIQEMVIYLKNNWKF